jgi:hypothetical protein
MAGHIHPPKIPAKYYKPIGQVIVGWNLTEVLMASILWHIYGIKDVKQGRVLIYWLSAANKLKVLAYSAKYFMDSSAIQKELMQLQKRASGMNVKRNLLAHGLWGHMPKDKLWKVFKTQESNDDLVMPRYEVGSKECDPVQIAKDILCLNVDLEKFMDQNGISPP